MAATAGGSIFFELNGFPFGQEADEKSHPGKCNAESPSSSEADHVTLENSRKLCIRESTLEVISSHGESLVDCHIWYIDWKIGNQAVVEYALSAGDTDGASSKLENCHVVRSQSQVVGIEQVENGNTDYGKRTYKAW